MSMYGQCSEDIYGVAVLTDPSQCNQQAPCWATSNNYSMTGMPPCTPTNASEDRVGDASRDCTTRFIPLQDSFIAGHLTLI
jgi:hypothetical protein